MNISHLDAKHCVHLLWSPKISRIYNIKIGGSKWSNHFSPKAGLRSKSHLPDPRHQSHLKHRCQRCRRRRSPPSRSGGRGWSPWPHGVVLRKMRGQGRRKYDWLVVWNMNLIFPYIGKNHSNWRTHIFQRGLVNHQPDENLGSQMEVSSWEVITCL